MKKMIATGVWMLGAALLGAWGCAQEPDAEALATPARAPLQGAADGLDAADRGCQVVLRGAGRVSDGVGGFQIDDQGRWILSGVIDVAPEAADAEVRVLFSANTAPEDGWWSFGTQPAPDSTPEAPRHTFTIDATHFGPGMSAGALGRATLWLIPYLQTDGGGRLFDHNRLPGDFDVYTLTSDNGWSVAPDEATCAAPTPQGPAWMGNPAVKLSRSSTDPCSGASPIEGGFLYESWARQRAAVRSFCFEVWEPGVTDWDNPDLWKTLDVQLHHRFQGQARWQTRYISLADRVGNNARYGADIGALDPFAWPGCPEAFDLQGDTARATMDFYVTVNGAPLLAPGGVPFTGTYAIPQSAIEGRCF